ncbi:MAG: LuxR C-terminal-related transcriptional regulator, partial [Candidatus Gastranaerophilales bacterium]|nr:LuxR C-terminal-related transcriptional regulator [Candidatus Gastranaerophilales bacterium]
MDKFFMEIRDYQIKQYHNNNLSKKSFDNNIQHSSNEISDVNIKNYSNAMKSIAFTGIKPSKELIEKELQSGKTIKDIREAYGFTKEQFQRYCKREKIVTPRKQAQINSENITKEQIQELLEQGKTRDEICKILGIKRNTLSTKITEFGLNKKGQTQKDNASKITKELLIQYIAEGKTNEEIAEIFNVSKSTVLNKKNKFGLVSDKKLSRQANEDITEQDITSRLELGLTQAQIMKELGIKSKSSYNRLLIRLNIQTQQKQAIEHNKTITREDITTRLDAGMPVKQIQEELGIKRSQWSKKLKEFGIETRDTQKYKNADSLTKELLEAERAAGMSVAAISEKYHVSQKAVYKRMHLHGIPLSQPKEKKIIDITKEDVLDRLAKGKSHKEIQEEFGLTVDKYRYRLAEFQILTDVQIQRDLIKNISKEQLKNAMQGKTSIAEIAKALGISEDTCAVKMKEFGFSTERQEHLARLDNVSGEEIQAQLSNNKTKKEICENLGIGESTYYKKLYKIGFISERKKSMLAAEAITREQLLSILSSNKSVKQICEELGIKSSESYYRKLDEFGLNTVNQLETERVSSITKEELLQQLMEGKSTSEICRTYNITPGRCKTLLRKHNLTTKVPPSKIDYKNTNVEELKNHITDIFCENEKLSDNVEINELTDFLTEKTEYSLRDYNDLMKFSQLFDGLEAGLTTPEEILKSRAFRHLNKAKTKAVEHFTEVNIQLDSLISYLSNFKNTGKILELCYKYQPKSPTDSTITSSDYLIGCIRGYMKKGDVGKNETKTLERRLNFWDKEQSSPNDDIFEMARKYATDEFGVTCKEKGGLFLEKYEQFKNLDFSEYPAHLVEELLKSGKELKPQDAVEYLIKFEKWQNMPENKQRLLSPFLEMFDTSNPTDSSIINSHIENFYNKIDTPITARGKHGTVTSSMKQDTVFAKKA